MNRGFASGARRLLIAIGVGGALAAALPGAVANAQDDDANCACGDCVSEDDGGLLGNYCASDCGAGNGDCFCGLLVTAAGGCASGDEMLWVRADYVLWDRGGVELPPLVTASPADAPEDEQAKLGFDHTSVLAGDAKVSDGLRSGWAIEAGLWLNALTGWAIAADYFNGGRDSYGFLVGPADGRVIARPFLNAETGEQDARYLDVPGELVGGAGVSVFDDFQGAGAWMEKCVWRRGNACTSAGGSRLSLLGGYRYYHHDSLVFAREDYMALDGNSFGLPEGHIHVAADKFAGRNEFHGVELGVEGRLQRCRWWCEGLAAVALGGSRRVVFVEGTKIVFEPNFDPVAFQGDLLTSGVTNFGRYTDDECQVVPRFRLEAGWQWTERIGLHVGYNLIVWDGIVQAADHLPPNLETDPRNLPEITEIGGAEPLFPGLSGSTLVAHGLDFGLELSF